jgi:hypothetical protein
MLLSDFLRKLGLNSYIMHEGKIKVILILLLSRNHNLKKTALILPDIFPIVIYSTDVFFHTTYYDHYFF